MDLLLQEDPYLMDLETKEVVNPLKWIRPCYRQYDHRWFSTKKSVALSNLDQQTTVYCTSDYSWKLQLYRVDTKGQWDTDYLTNQWYITDATKADETHLANYLFDTNDPKSISGAWLN